MSIAGKIPESVLRKMGEHQLEIDGVSLRIKVTSYTEITNHIVETELDRYMTQQTPATHVCTRRTYASGCEVMQVHRIPQPKEPKPVVVGVDFIFPNKKWTLFPRGFIVLCLPNNFCLIAAIKHNAWSTELRSFFHKKPIFLVGFKRWSSLRCRRCGFKDRKKVIDLSEFAARVRKLPGVYKSKSFDEVAEGVGVEYDHTQAEAARAVKSEVRRYWDDLVFSASDVRAVVYNAFVSCKVARVLMGELPSPATA